MRIFKHLSKWLGFRPRRKPVGELCPHSGRDYLFVCKYVRHGQCKATLRESLDCALNDKQDLAAIRKELAETEGNLRGKS